MLRKTSGLPRNRKLFKPWVARAKLRKALQKTRELKMKVSLANLLKTYAEKMPDSVSEPKLMKTSEFYGARADLHHNKRTYPLPGSRSERRAARDRSVWEPRFRRAKPLFRPSYSFRSGEKYGLGGIAWAPSKCRVSHTSGTTHASPTKRPLTHRLAVPPLPD